MGASGTAPGPGGGHARAWDPGEPVFVEDVAGSARPAAYYLAESRDGLYVPYVVRTPAGRGRFPFVFLAYGNGGGGIGWLRHWVRTRPHITERLLAAGYACGWGRYRTEVDLGFDRGGPLMVDARQGMEVMNRSPLEFEDELAILGHVAGHPQVDADRLGHHRRDYRVPRPAPEAGSSLVALVKDSASTGHAPRARAARASLSCWRMRSARAA